MPGFQQPCPLGRRHFAPGLETGLGGGDGAAGLDGAKCRHLGQGLTVGGVYDGQGGAIVGVDPRPIGVGSFHQQGRVA
ncbi:hypothetical protein D3C76_763350 [compost metagenome]